MLLAQKRDLMHFFITTNNFSFLFRKTVRLWSLNISASNYHFFFMLSTSTGTCVCIYSVDVWAHRPPTCRWRDRVPHQGTAVQAAPWRSASAYCKHTFQVRLTRLLNILKSYGHYCYLELLCHSWGRVAAYGIEGVSNNMHMLIWTIINRCFCF